MDGCQRRGSCRVRSRGLILTGLAVLALAAPTGGMAGTLPGAQPCEGSSVGPAAAFLDTSAGDTAGDLVSADPALAVEQTPDPVTAGGDPGFGTDQRSDSILVDVSWGGFGPQSRLTVLRSGRANMSSSFHGRYQRNASFTLSRSRL